MGIQMSESIQTGTGTYNRQTTDRPVTTNYREMEDAGSELENLNLFLLLVKLMQEKALCFHYLM